MQHHIPEHSRRLGRHVNHDPRSKAFRPETAPGVKSVTHATVGLPLDQGQIGSCTANALVGALNTAPNYAGKARTETDAVKLYSRETTDEGQPYPPNDPGGSGLAVCKAAVELGWIKSYAHALSLDEALKALVLRPVITGVNWYDSFDKPASSGLVSIADGATVRGGHEVLVYGIDAENQQVLVMNSWGKAYGVNGTFRFSFDTWSQLLSEQGDVTIPQP